MLAPDMKTASCCPEMSWPAMMPDMDYVPAGKELHISGLKIYEVGNRTEQAIVVLPEIYGWDGRLKPICDTFALAGYLVVMPDLFHGETAHGKSDEEKGAWLRTFPFQGRIDKDLGILFDHLQHVQRIACVGFCWGAWAGWKAAAHGFPLQCGAFAHPSTKIERTIFGADEEALARAVKMPVLLLPAGNDPAELKEGAVLKALPHATSKVFPEMKHGWVTRGDFADPSVERDVQHAMKLIFEHLRLHM